LFVFLDHYFSPYILFDYILLNNIIFNMLNQPSCYISINKTAKKDSPNIKRENIYLIINLLLNLTRLLLTLREIHCGIIGINLYSFLRDPIYLSPQILNCSNTGSNAFPKSVSEYSTLGGISE